MPPGFSPKYALVHAIHLYLQGFEHSHLITSLIAGKNGELYTRQGRARDTAVSR